MNTGNDARELVPDCCYGGWCHRRLDCDDLFLALARPRSLRRLELGGAWEGISLARGAGRGGPRASSGQPSRCRPSGNPSSHPFAIRVLRGNGKAVLLGRPSAPDSLVSLPGAQGVPNFLRVAALRAAPIRGRSVFSLGSPWGGGAP